MKGVTKVTLCLLCFSSATYANTFTDLFSGITIGAGYASDIIQNATLGGYTIYSQGYILPSMKDYLFTDFRMSSTSNTEYYSFDNSLTFDKLDVDLKRYQASIGMGYPFEVADSIIVKPYVTAGWSWDKGTVNNDTYHESATYHDDSFLASVGVRGEFGEHVVAGVGYSKESSGLDLGQWTLDVGYRF